MEENIRYTNPNSEEDQFNQISLKKRNLNSFNNPIFENKTSKLSNTINSIGFTAFNNNGRINRKDILSSYNQKILEETWIHFSKYIRKNYESGKGTFIKGFGTFTYCNPEYNLEGTTNQYKRDLKLRRPIFIVSKEFLDYLKPGQFTKNGGLIYYTQQKNNNVNINKINYNEIAFSLNISKEECNEIIKNMIGEMADKIRENKFISRELPGVGIILIRGNIFGIKFNDEFITDIYKKTEKLNFNRKNIHFYLDTYRTNQSMGDIKNVEKSMNELVSKISPITHLTHGADKWLSNNMGINPEEYDNSKENNMNFNKVENYNQNQLWNSQSFFRAPSHGKLILRNKQFSITNKINEKNNMDEKANTLNNMNKDILKAIVANKGQLIKELKVYDRRNNGLISRFEVVRAFQKCNIHPQLSIEKINDIIKIYASGLDYIDYYKLLTLLIKEIKQILKHTSFIREGNTNSLFSSFNTKFQFGPKILNRNTEENNNFNKTNYKSFRNNFNFKINNENDKDNISNKDQTKDFNFNNYNNLKIYISEVEKEIMSIKLVLDGMMTNKKAYMNSVELEKFLDNDNEINYVDFIQILRIFGITYPREKVLKVLKFIKIENPLKMTLNLLNKKFNQCKITSSEMTNYELEEALNKILSDDKLNIKQILFNKNNNEISQNEFISLLHDKTLYSDDILSALFLKLSNKKQNVSYNNFNNILNNSKNKDPNNLGDKFYHESCERILSKIKSLGLNTNEYFNKLLKYNYLRNQNAMKKIDFVLAFQQEEYKPPFTESQLSFIFDKMKTNNSGILERNEFKNAINKEYNALFKMQDIVKKSKLSLEDLAFRFDISYSDPNKRMNFWEFKTKMKKMNSYYTNEFIEGLYIELAGNLDNTLNCKYLLDSLNVYKKGTFTKSNNESFIKNFINNLQNKVDYHTLKAAFEKEDTNFSGKISKNIFCSIINRYTKEFKDEDLMRFIRLTGLADNINYEVKYNNFINMIYFNEKLDAFLLCVNELNNIYLKEANKNMNNLISIVNGNQNSNNYITVEQLFLFLDKRIKEKNENKYNNNYEPITKTLVCKFDLDSDGKVSIEDLKGILERYTHTNFFKYENNSKNQNVNLFSSEVLSDDEFKAIVRKIKENMKRKNITEVGLFRKLDENNDGFINNIEFNKNIKEIIDINPAMEDKFFNYLDVYKNGMIDLDTFLLRFKEFKSDNTIIENNNKIENIILNKLSSYFIKHSKKLNDCEIFSLMDKDSDGLISLDDFRSFVINELNISKNEFTEYKLERVMQTISLSKNKNIGLADIREYMNKSLSNSDVNKHYVDLKETFKETNNLNLSKNKKNNDWIAQAIEKFGMYISEKYDNTINFFNLFANKEENKFKFDHFIKFIEKDYDCFKGFNLTRDELLSIFTSLDSQKKNYLTLEDLQNKLDLFDFYRKMHLDIKNFLHNNFPNQVDSFSYFLPYENLPTNQGFTKSFTNRFYTPNKILLNNRYNYNTNSKYLNTNNDIVGVTTKQFVDGINNLFPSKYPIETILKYIKKYFNVDIDKNEILNNKENKDTQLITFSQFTFVYYGIICNDKDFKMNKNRLKKISTTRSSTTEKYINDFNKLHIKNNLGRIPFNHNLYRGEEEILGPHPINHLDHPIEFLAHEKLITPFDKDPLDKIRRIIVSSPNQNYLQMIKDFVNEFKDNNYICNEFQFKNLIKQLNIGLTNIEIEDILTKSGRTYNGLININDFYKYLTSKDKSLNKSGQNTKITLAEFKQLLYKYYSNPKLAFIFNDSEQSNRMDFVKFKSIINELYTKENRPVPNFAMMKNCFDYIDLRKDGLIDLVEWSNVFGNVRGKLDLSRSVDLKKGVKTLQKWEMSNNLIEVYKNISKNRKLISQKVKTFSFGAFIQEDNLINILKEIFPKYKFNNTQWKMIVEIGNKDHRGFINYDTFIMIVENCAKREEMPRYMK